MTLQATRAGHARPRTASQRLATSIVPCAHQRSGTPRRSRVAPRRAGRHGAESPIRSALSVRAVAPDGARPARSSRVQVVRLDPDLPLPSYAHPGDAGADLVTTVDVTLAPGERALVPTGIAMALPEGYVALVHPRSGLAARHGLSIVNTPGTIDAGYRGEVKVLLVNLDPREPVVLRRGDRVAQLVVQRVEQRRVRRGRAHFPSSARGDGGYGSTGGFGTPGREPWLPQRGVA